MTDKLNIVEGNYFGSPHILITLGSYSKYQRRKPNVAFPHPLCEEEKMWIVLCERVLELEAKTVPPTNDAVGHHLFCGACSAAKGLKDLYDGLDTHYGKEHCECCGRYRLVWGYTPEAVTKAFVKNKVESRRDAHTDKPKKYYYVLLADTHENRVKILEWMRDGVAEMGAGNAGWVGAEVLYPGATYRKLVTDENGWLTDPEYISTLVKIGRAIVSIDPTSEWQIARHSTIGGIKRLMNDGSRYKVREDTSYVVPPN